MEISIILNNNDLREYLENGFYPKKLATHSLQISRIAHGDYSDEYELFLKGDPEDLREFLLFYGYSHDEISTWYGI